MSLNIVTVNMGGMTHNPFEYYTSENISDTGDTGDISNIRVTRSKCNTRSTEWDYKTILGMLTKTKLLGFFEKFSHEQQTKYARFIEYVKTLELENDVILDHFFCDVKTAAEKLALENKFGRADSSIKRFNPIEFGYDAIYFEGSLLNQYNYVRDYSINGKDIGVLLERCLGVPSMNTLFCLDNTEWLSKTYDIERVYDIILYDMMKTYSVYVNYVEFDKIYISNIYDSRLDRLLDKLGDTPAIIVTQEGGFCDAWTTPNNNRVKLEYESSVENGVKFYTYNLDIDMYRINSIPDSISAILGNKKGIDIEFLVGNKLIRVCGLHCKEPKGERTYKKFVENGVLKLLEYEGVMNNIRYMFDWVYNKYYSIENSMEIIMGDFNPKNNEKSTLIKQLVEGKTNMKVVPDINTTNKTRSGYCAQLGKFWKESKVCKDMLIIRQENLVCNTEEVFPCINELITEKWVGDHSAVLANVQM